LPVSTPWRADTAESLPARLRATLRRQFAPPTVVLLYHRVLPVIDRDVNQLALSTENFARHLAWLAGNTRPLLPSEFAARLDRSAMTQFTLDGGKPRVLLTFDDGYADNFHHALPLLVEHGRSAVVFALTGMVGTDQPFWWDALEQIVFDGWPAAGGWSLPDGALVPAYPDRALTYRILHSVLKPLADDARRAVLASLAAQAAVTPRANGDSRSMRWQELRAWRAAGLQVGGHTRTHAQLSALGANELRDEVAGSKQYLEQQLGAPVEMFAYPYGSTGDFDARAVQTARDAGFHCAFANRPGHTRWARDRFALPRYLVRNWAADEFAARVQKWCRG
jgi:peptidoglycan/xylan/chitin deacetylase (PgdA/CDA1 family)